MSPPFSSREIYAPREEPPQSSLLRDFLSYPTGIPRQLLRIAGAALRRFSRWLRDAPSQRILLRRLLLSFSALLGAGFLAFVLLLAFVLATLPDVNDIRALTAAESTVITDRNGIELYRIHGEEDRTFVPLPEIAESLKQATIAIEDERFQTRGCFDPRAFLRAVLRNVIGGFGSQGGSTITQQFAKNALIGTRKKRVTRKLKEYILSCQLEGRYSKDEILELYLNRIPYGQNVHGAEQAAQNTFAKSASGLTLAESSVLAALPQLPSYLNPYGEHARSELSEEGERRLAQGKIRDASDLRDEDFWIGIIGGSVPVPGAASGTTFYLGGRTDQVLQNMESQGFITAEERRIALAGLQTMTFRRARENIRAPHFVFAVRDEIETIFRDRFPDGFLERGGLRIETTLDWHLQETAERIVREAGEMNESLYGAHNAAVLAADVREGQILAYVGNRDYWDEAHDGNVDVIKAPRQPGSSFKPFAYAAAFLAGASPATVLYDIPIEIAGDEPENFDRTFWGPVTIRRALGGSRNIPAAEAFFLAGGEEKIIALAEQLGVPSVRRRKEELSASQGKPYAYGWPLAIGAAEVPLQEMVSGYLSFARAGQAIPLSKILRVEDREGNILFEVQKEPPGRDALDPRIAHLVTSVLSDEAARPSAYWRTQLTVPGFQTAAKTGTSNKCFRRAPPKPPSLQGKCLESRPDNNWTLGYTPEVIGGAWVGNASGGAMYVKASGLDTASHIWRPVMIAAHNTVRASGGAAPKSLQTTFTTPPGLVSAQISELSGKLASPCTPLERRRADLFLEGQEPKEPDDACAELEVDKLTGLLASDECPAEARERRSFFTPGGDFTKRFPTWTYAVRLWAEGLASGSGGAFRDSTGARRGTGAFLPLPLPLAPTEKCRLALTPGRLVKPTVRLLAPEEGGTATMPSFVPKISFTVGHAVQEVIYELDSRIVARSGSGSSSLMPIIRIPRRFDAEGIHTLRVILTDSYFNQAEDTVRFRFAEDGGPPAVRVLSPAPGAVLTIGALVTVRIEAEDRGGGIDRVQFFLGGKLITTRRNPPYEATFTVEGEPGPSALKVVALDPARNEGSDEIPVELVKE